MMKKNMHLTEDECREIEHLLKEQVSLDQISVMLGISAAAILREARIFEQARDKFERYLIHNNCAKRRDCDRRYLCGDYSVCSKGCSGCGLCNEMCDDFTQDTCFRVYESPYCCDGCDEEYKCVLHKVFYLSKSVREACQEKSAAAEFRAYSYSG